MTTTVLLAWQQSEGDSRLSTGRTKSGRMSSSPGGDSHCSRGLKRFGEEEEELSQRWVTLCASTALESESDHQNTPTSAPSTVVLVPRPSVYQPTAPRPRSFAGLSVTLANPLLQPRPTSAQPVHPIGKPVPYLSRIGIEIVPHPRV